MAKKAHKAFLLSILALALAACSSFGSGKDVAVNPNLFPSAYKRQIVATLIELFKKNETISVSNALISPPVLAQVGQDQRYTLCVRYTAHGTSPGMVADSTRRAYFYAGQLNQLVPVKDEACSGVAYQPFKELNSACLGKACEERAKKKSGWSLF